MSVIKPISSLQQVLPLAAALLLLSGCGALPEHGGFSAGNDGAPRHTIDIAAIPDAEPRIEANSRYGNPPSYVVNGKRYHVMQSNKAFQQNGIASWYGTKFHGRKTSSGEPYDMFAMTAAHKTLPLPTWLEVINQDNQKRIIVKVNDRGPFIGNRIIDLSYAAATKLGVVATGTANVSIRAIDPAQYLASKNQSTPINTTPAIATAIPAPTTAPATTLPLSSELATSLPSPAAVPAAEPLTISGFYLQVAAFNERSNAEQLLQRLLPLKPGTVSIDPQQNAGHATYRVRIGPLISLSEAGKIAARLTSLGMGEPRIMLD